MSATFAGSSAAAASPSARELDRRFLLVHALLVPATFALLAWLAQASGADQRLASLFYDPAAGQFQGRGWPALELIGHRLAKSAVWALWLGLVAAAIASHVVPRLAGGSRVLWLTVLAMALGPVIVVGLKDINTHHCPWDLKLYGGTADFGAEWFVSRAQAGRCFPGGHAAGGFSVVALAFAGRLAGHARLQAGALLAALLLGTVFSVVRMIQGAHFLSHNLMAAAVVWWTAAAVFAPALLTRGAAPRVAAA